MEFEEEDKFRIMGKIPMISSLEVAFINTWNLLYRDIKWEREIVLIPDRKFRFDFVHIASRVAVEVSGGIYQHMGHSTGKGLERDYEKLNLAMAEGWMVFQLSSNMINPLWLKIIKQTIDKRL